MGDLASEDQSNTYKESDRSVSKWAFGTGEGSWQGTGSQIKQRTAHLYNNSEMSDILLNACDENWWFGDTVKDFNAHRFLLGTASPIFHKILYDWEEEEEENYSNENTTPSKDRFLILDTELEVTLTLVPCFDYHRLELEGIPPIAAEALLEYIYKDSFDESDYENGYSRNLLWRLWHASKALEMDHLHQKSTETLHRTMCEDTVFWDLNYAIKYKSLGTDEIRTKVLKLMEGLEERLFEHPNFVWLDHSAVSEILDRRVPKSCEPMTIYNNLLRWSMYQIDRSACSDLEGSGISGSQIPITERLEWIEKCRKGTFDHVPVKDLDKYLIRGLEKMPWTEMSQSDFLQYVVKAQVVILEQILLQNAISIMEIAVKNPERLTKSAFSATDDKENIQNSPKPKENGQKSPKTSRVSALFNGPSATKRG